MMFSRTVLAVLALAVSGVQSDTCSFVSPSPPSNQGDSTYGLGEAFDISWSWDMEAGDLIIYQDYPPLKGGSYLFKRLDMGISDTSFTWNIDLANLIAFPGDGSQPQFHFEILIKDQPDIACSSHTFQVDVQADPRAAQSVDTAVHYLGATASSHTQKSTGDSGPTISGPHVTSSTGNKHSATSDPDSGSSSSSGTKDGLIATATLLGLSLIANIAGAFFLFRKKGRRNNNPTTDASSESKMGYYGEVPKEANGDHRLDPYGNVRSELPGSNLQTSYQSSLRGESIYGQQNNQMHDHHQYGHSDQPHYGVQEHYGPQ